MHRDGLALTERGSVLVGVMFLIILLAGLSLNLLNEGMAERASVKHHESSQVAFELAELGLIQSELEIRSKKDPDKDGLGTLQRTLPQGSFSVTAAPAAAAGQFVLTSAGTQGLSRRTLEVVIQAAPSKLWDYGIVGRTSLRIRNDPGSLKKLLRLRDTPSKRLPTWLEIDGYDSRLGTYQQQANAGVGWPHMDDGRVASNGPVTLDGWVKDFGDAQAGPGGFATALLNGATVSDATVPLATPLKLPDPPLADFEAAYATNQNALLDGVGKSNVDKNFRASIDGGKPPITLPAGTYLFHDLTIRRGVTLEVAGPVKIYLTGALKVEEEVSINSKGRPGDVQIIAHPYKLPYLKKPDKKAEIQLKTDLHSAFALYAPERDFNWKDKQDLRLSGSLVGRNFDIRSKAKEDSPKLHYDISLGEVAFDYTFTQRLSWRETSVNPR